MDEHDARTPVVLVSGWSGPRAEVVRSLQRPGTVVVEHDLSDLHQGVLRRTVTIDGRPRASILELAHGCVSCTLREDLLPLLRKLSARSSVDRIVLVLDRALEPEAVCWAIHHVVVAGLVGGVDGPAVRDVRIDAVLNCVDAQTWLEDATGADVLADRGVVASVDDDRTVAQVVVGQVEFADAIVVSGEAPDSWTHARLHAVLNRLAPTASMGVSPQIDAEGLLQAIPDNARRGVPADPHGPLLRGQPPLLPDAGVTIVEFVAERPFHPGRLHDAVDVLLDGVVTARGRVWVATQPDEVLWLESAGSGLRVGNAGTWLASMTPEEQEEISPERRAMAAARWNDRFGDRESSLVVLTHGADPTDIDRALQWALVTDDELADESSWATWHDPFGDWHADPCGDAESPLSDSTLSESDREDRA